MLLRESYTRVDRDASLRKARKEYGAYFTPRSIARAASSLAFSPFESDLLSALGGQHGDEAAVIAGRLLSLKICDPMAGDGAFFVEAIKCLSDIRDNLAELLPKNNIEASNLPHPEFFEDSQEAREGYAEYVKRHCIYGVDLNTSCVSSLRRIINDESDPELSNVKQGNSLVSPTGLNLQILSLTFKAEIACLVGIRTTNVRGDPGNTFARKKATIERRLKTAFTTEGASELDPFLWEIEFPEVFFDSLGNPKENPGFDFVIGNPPWEVVKPNDREFFTTFFPDFFGKNRSERDRIKEHALKDPHIALEYERYLERLRALTRYFKHSGHYHYQGSKGGVSPNFNLYKIAFERFYQLSKADGYVSIITPLGLASDSGTKGVRSLLFDSARLRAIWGFSPASRLFLGVDQAFAICIYRKGGKSQRFRSVTGLLDSVEISHYDADDGILIDSALVKKTSPLTWSIPSIRNPIEKEILLRLSGFSSLGEKLSDTWNVSITRGLDETNDRHMFRDYDTGVPLLKGRDVFPFTVGNPMLWVDPIEYESRSRDSRFSRVVWRDVARPNLTRRMFAALAPPGYALGNSLNYMIVNGEEMTKHYLIGMLNSLAVDYRIRQITSNSHINQYVVSQLTIPRLGPGHAYHDQISQVSRSLSLSGTHGRIWNTEECELNATVAKIYGLARKELEYILDFYSWLPGSHHEEVMKRFDH